MAYMASKPRFRKLVLMHRALIVSRTVLRAATYLVLATLQSFDGPSGSGSGCRTLIKQGVGCQAQVQVLGSISWTPFPTWPAIIHDLPSQLDLRKQSIAIIKIAD